MGGTYFDFINEDGSTVHVTLDEADDSAVAVVKQDQATLPGVFRYGSNLKLGYTYAPAGQPSVRTRMRIGMDAKSPDLVTYPGLSYNRQFAGASLPSLKGLPPGVRYHPSIALGSGVRPSHSSMLTYFAQSGPTPDNPWYITTDHEVNRTSNSGKPSPAQFKSNMAWLRNELDASPFADCWKIVEIYDTYAQLNGQGDWRDYTSDLQDAIGWDTYDTLRAHPLPYQSVDVLLAPWFASGATVMPELGIIPRDSDPTGTGAADQYALFVDTLADSGCTDLGLWGTVGNQFDYTPPPDSVIQWCFRRLISSQ